MGKVMRWIGQKLRFLKVLKYLNPLRYIKRLDWYIIKKFVGYYFFSIALIITIAIVFDFNDNLSEVYRVSCTSTSHHLRLLCQLRAILRQPLQCAVRVRSGHHVHLQAGRQFRDDRHAGIGSIVQAPASPVHDYLHIPLALSYTLSAYVIRTARSSDRTLRRCTRTRRRIPLPKTCSCRWTEA